MSTVERPPAYHAYLLRCWLDGSNWRYSLEEVGSGKRQGFATLDEFVTFLVAISSTKVEGTKAPEIESSLPETNSGAYDKAKKSSSGER